MTEQEDRDHPTPESERGISVETKEGKKINPLKDQDDQSWPTVENKENDQ